MLESHMCYVKSALPRKLQNTLVSVNCQLLRKSRKKNTPLFNEFASISVNLDESEATQFYKLDEIMFTCIH